MKNKNSTTVEFTFKNSCGAGLIFDVSRFDKITGGEIYNHKGSRQLYGSELKFWIETLDEDVIFAKAWEQLGVDDMAFAKSQKEYSMSDGDDPKGAA